MVGWVKDLQGGGGGGGGSAKEKVSRFQPSRGWHLWLICIPLSLTLITVCGMLFFLQAGLVFLQIM